MRTTLLAIAAATMLASAAHAANPDELPKRFAPAKPDPALAATVISNDDMRAKLVRMVDSLGGTCAAPNVLQFGYEKPSKDASRYYLLCADGFGYVTESGSPFVLRRLMPGEGLK